MIVAGTLLMAGCVAIAAYAGHGVAHYGWALGVLGIGWNLLFIAATTLLTKTYRRDERIQAQTLNDFLVFGAQAAASLLAGVAVTTIGWERLNLATLPLLAAVLARDLRALAAACRRHGLDAVEEAADFSGEGGGGILEHPRWIGRYAKRRLGELRGRFLVAGNDEAAHDFRQGGRELVGDERAASGTDEIDALQAQLLDQVDDGEREPGDRHAALRGVRPAAAGEIRRVYGTIGTEQRGAAVEVGAGAVLRVQEQDRRRFVEAAARRVGGRRGATGHTGSRGTCGAGARAHSPTAVSSSPCLPCSLPSRYHGA